MLDGMARSRKLEGIALLGMALEGMARPYSFSYWESTLDGIARTAFDGIADVLPSTLIRVNPVGGLRRPSMMC